MYKAATLSPLPLDTLLAPIAHKIEAMNARIVSELNADTLLINTLSDYVIGAGGKRLRPAVLLLGAQACGYDENSVADEVLSAVIEFIHTATLLHDDVVDGSEMRRGNKTANNVWGNQAAVLVGDFLYSRSFQMMASIGDIDVVKCLSSATNVIAEGEVLQLVHCNDPDTTRDDYYKIIYRKTAALFEAAGALSAQISPQKELAKPLQRFGKHLGIAFQLVDDALDYQGDSDQLGKNVGDDLAEGKVTLPMIFAMEAASTHETERTMLREAIKNGKSEHQDAIISLIKSSGALKRTKKDANEHIALAIEAAEELPPSTARQSLIGIAHFCGERLY